MTTGILKKTFSSIIEFIFPKICFVCNCRFNSGNFNYICDKCIDNITLAPPSEIIFDNIQTNFNPDDLAISSIYSLMNFYDLRDLIHNLKYNGLYKIGSEAGILLAKKISMENADKIHWDYIIPLPIHKAKKRERGYNQSDIIAKAVSSQLDIPFQSKIIARSRYTITQTLLNGTHRRTNVEKAFEIAVDETYLKGKKILLIDDVITTGSTLNSCAKALLEAGALRVDAATLASASN